MPKDRREFNVAPPTFSRLDTDYSPSTKLYHCYCNTPVAHPDLL